MRGPEWLLSLDALLLGETHPLSGLANAAALLYQSVPDINWAGFYFLDNGALWLGPFGGKPACVQISPGRGVCGAALAQNTALAVPDVHLFPGHIACDAASRSEIVVPLRHCGRPVGVLDIDSPTPGRFTDGDIPPFAAAMRILESRLDLSRLSYNLTE